MSTQIKENLQSRTKNALSDLGEKIFLDRYAIKDAKKDRNTKINKVTKDIHKKSKLGEKILYNKATFRKAAQYMVDNDISSNEAKRIAKTEARRNTLAALALIGGGYIYAKKKL